MSDSVKILLDESEIPEKWYNIVADMPHKLIGPEALAPLFSMEPIKQGVSQETRIEIPEAGEVYKLWRPTPLYDARGLEKALDTPAKIYYNKIEATLALIDTPSEPMMPA